MKTILIASLLTLILNSCHIDKYVVIEKDSLKTAFILNSSPTFKGYYYVGTNSDFHYFESRWKLEKDRYFKIRRTDFRVIEPYKLGEKEVKIDLLNDTKIVFGQNEYYTLYIVK